LFAKICCNVINELYKQVDCLVFPSKLETWGLPISEFKAFNKPVLVADMLYANETVGNYDKVNFFPADDHKKLAILMKQFIKNEIRYDGNTVSEPAYPFFNNWNALMAFLTEEKNYSPKQVQQ
ncbi:MAG: glycosyltransferase, partial [Sphingobacteriaceae bacterium]